MKVAVGPPQWHTISAILDWRDEGIDAATRYLLLRVYTLYGTEPMKETVEELSGKVGLSAPVVIRSRDRLLEQGVFVPVKVLSRSQKQVGAMLAGRRRAGFRINAQFLEGRVSRFVERRGRSIPGPIREAALQDLFCGQAGAKQKQPRRGRPKGQADRLSPENRVLLGVLWGLADEYGVIRDAGGSSLRRLSGLSNTQVRNQLAKLQRLEYIHKRVPGASCKGAFGKADGSIVLNALRPEYGVNSDDVPRFPIKVSLGEVPRAHKLAAQLRKSPLSMREAGAAPNPAQAEIARYSRDARELMDLILAANPYLGGRRRTGGPPSQDECEETEGVEEQVWGDFPRLDRLLLDEHVGAAARYIRAKLAMYAADILNAAEDLSAFDKLDHKKAPDEILIRIRQEAVTSRMQDAYDEPELSALVVLFYGWAWYLARDVVLGTRRALGRPKGNWIAEGHFVIVPLRLTDQLEVLFFKKRLKSGIAPIGSQGHQVSSSSIQQG